MAFFLLVRRSICHRLVPSLKYAMSILGVKHALPTMALQLCEPDPHVRAPALVTIVKRPIRRAAPDLLWDGIDQRQRLPFHSLAVLDVDRYSVPLKHISMLVAQRRGANQEPAIFAVSPLKAHFILGRLPSGHVRAPLFYSPWEVLGMNRARWVFKFLLERNARIFQPTLIDEINGAVGPKAPGHGRNCVNDEPHTLFKSIRCSCSIAVVRFISALPHVIFAPVERQHIIEGKYVRVTTYVNYHFDIVQTSTYIYLCKS